jgi:hypothetical protein
MLIARYGTSYSYGRKTPLRQLPSATAATSPGHHHATCGAGSASSTGINSVGTSITGTSTDEEATYVTKGGLGQGLNELSFFFFFFLKILFGYLFN